MSLSFKCLEQLKNPTLDVVANKKTSQQMNISSYNAPKRKVVKSGSKARKLKIVMREYMHDMSVWNSVIEVMMIRKNASSDMRSSSLKLSSFNK